MSHAAPRQQRASSQALQSAQTAYETAPAGVALIAFAVLAGVRVGGAWSTVFMVASIALTPLTVLLIGRARWPDAGLHATVTPRALVEGIAAVLASYAVVVAACTAAFGDENHNWLAGVRTVFDDLAPGQRWLALALAIPCMGILIPVAEEVCYRGVLHDAASRRAGPAAAVVLTATGWALVHLGDYGLHPFDGLEIVGMLPSVLLMGLALGWCRIRTGSALACIVAQGVANLALTAWVFGVMS